MYVYIYICIYACVCDQITMYIIYIYIYAYIHMRVCGWGCQECPTMHSINKSLRAWVDAKYI